MIRPLAEIGIPESELVLGETCYEFYVDEEKLEERILRLFCTEKYPREDGFAVLLFPALKSCTNSEINFQKN